MAIQSDRRLCQASSHSLAHELCPNVSCTCRESCASVSVFIVSKSTFVGVVVSVLSRFISFQYAHYLDLNPLIMSSRCRIPKCSPHRHSRQFHNSPPIHNLLLHMAKWCPIRYVYTTFIVIIKQIFGLLNVNTIYDKQNETYTIFEIVLHILKSKLALCSSFNKHLIRQCYSNSYLVVDRVALHKKLITASSSSIDREIPAH